MKSANKTRIAFILLGIASTIWFFIRVVPKPGRAGYPCMKVAAPMMSGFILYLVSLTGSVMVFRQVHKLLFKKKFLFASVFLMLAILLSLIFFSVHAPDASALPVLITTDEPNTPMGEAKGIFPGRVVWVMDKDATNENCTNKVNDYWFMEKNTSQSVIDTLLADGLKHIAGQQTIAGSWNAIFRYFNTHHGRGAAGYSSGEKIVIKINLSTMGNGERHFNHQMNATPQLVLSLLKELIDTVNIAQSDITIGDPFRGMPDEIYDLCHTAYPDVHYIEGLGSDGREQTEISKDNEYFNSDDNFQSRLPQAYIDAVYLINMPCLKSHNSAGITIAAKNHQGSVIGPDQDATSQYMGPYLHYDYPVDRGYSMQAMGLYRHIVDFMAHEKLGGNTLIYIVDAIWSGNNWDGIVEKWQMPPFNNDWTSSLLISQDPVAIESVGFDLLYNEYKNYPGSHGNANYPLISGVQDYIHQAADPDNWPEGMVYDPSTPDHSIPVGSLGVHEHWNNATDMKYSRNLGLNTGIELFSDFRNFPSGLTDYTAEGTGRLKVLPNPVKDIVIMEYLLTENSDIHVELYSMDGKMVVKTGKTRQSAGINTLSLPITDYHLPEGTYICKVTADHKIPGVLTSKITIGRGRSGF